jgi:hypothetical protein
MRLIGLYPELILLMGLPDFIEVSPLLIHRISVMNIREERIDHHFEW